MKKLTFILLLIAASFQAQITSVKASEMAYPYMQAIDTMKTGVSMLNIATDGDSVFFVNEKGERSKYLIVKTPEELWQSDLAKAISGGGVQGDRKITPGTIEKYDLPWVRDVLTPSIDYDDVNFILAGEVGIERTKWTETITVLNPGDTLCSHDYIQSQLINQGARGIACAVYHGNDPCGCSWNWPTYRQICKLCLRHEQVSKTCESIPQPKKLTYSDYLKQLNEK
jgi:hypothetical protein